jgi:hypothetical protein
MMLTFNVISDPSQKVGQAGNIRASRMLDGNIVNKKKLFVIKIN